MNKIHDQALDAVRHLSPDQQDDMARAIRSRALEAQGFVPAPGGYAFRAASQLMFGGAKRYLVTAAQADEIAGARNTKSDVALAVLAASIAAAAVFGLPAYLMPAGFLGGHTIGHMLFWMAQGGVVLLAQVQSYRWLAFRRLRPILARLPLAAE